MAERQLTLTEEEHKYLVDTLKELWKETRIEEHRTRKPSYRQVVVQNEEVINSLLTKLGQPPK